MILVSAGELSFCNCKAFLEQFARLKEGDRLVIERAEDNNTVWLYMKFHTKARFNYFRSWHCSKELLTKEQLELIRSIPYEAMIKDNDITTDTYWDELLKEDLEHGTDLKYLNDKGNGSNQNYNNKEEICGTL